ncbi:hypothetical protein OY671_008437, partial [Metschnikowia pulcherrima]
MISQSLTDLWYGFGVAFQLHNSMWSFFGVSVGNLIGVLPGMGASSAISISSPSTYVMQPVPAISMSAGIFYGSQYGGAIGAISVNSPSHPPHAVTCLDGYPSTKQGKGGTALGITMICSFFAASVGIIVMIFASPSSVEVAFKFGPAEYFSSMCSGSVGAVVSASGSSPKAIAMIISGSSSGMVGTDVNSGVARFDFGVPESQDGIDFAIVAMGVFGFAEIMTNLEQKENRVDITDKIGSSYPNKQEFKESYPAVIRGTAS